MLIHFLTSLESSLLSLVHFLGGVTEVALLGVVIGISLGKAPQLLSLSKSLVAKIKSVLGSIKAGFSRVEVDLHLKAAAKPTVTVSPVFSTLAATPELTPINITQAN
jgi:hypothetical protein